MPIIIRTEKGAPLSEEISKCVAQLSGLRGQDIVQPELADAKDPDYLLHSYRKSIERAVEAFKLICDALKSNKNTGNVDALKGHYLSLLETRKTSQGYQNQFSECLQGLELLLTSQLDITQKRARKLLSKADEYAVLSVQSKPILATVTPILNTAEFLVQMEVPQPPLSSEKCQEFLHAKPGDGQAPAWYKVMDKDERLFFDKIMQDVTTEEEVRKKFHAISSRHRTIPGVANFSRHVMAVLDQEGKIIYQAPDRYRSSMVSSRDMLIIKKNQPLRDDFTLHNLQQIIRNALEERLRDPEKRKALLEDDGENINLQKLEAIPILVQTLITPLAGAGFFIPDPALYEDKRKAVQKIMAEGLKINIDNQEVTIKPNLFDTNHPLNKARSIMRTGSFLESGETAKEARRLSGLISNREPREEEATTATPLVEFAANGEKKPKELILEAAQDLEALVAEVSRTQDNQRELHLAALEELMTMELGGISYGSCISGKDRKGLETMYVDAMLLYHHLYGKLPKYNDADKDPQSRDNFIDIFVDIYLTRHQHVNAGQNAPGSDGIKTPARYLSDDIQKRIQRKSSNPDILTESNRLASNNEFDKVLAMTSATSSSALIYRRFEGGSQPIDSAALISVNLEKLQEVVNDLRDIINSPYWNDKGEALLGKKTPTGIGEMRDHLKQQSNWSDMGLEQLKEIVSCLGEICEGRSTSSSGKRRNITTTSPFYELMMSIRQNIEKDEIKRNDMFILAEFKKNVEPPSQRQEKEPSSVPGPSVTKKHST